ncbi:MAG: hypothetical protein WEB53_02025 [Akkermansiaceae bacterium]
MTLRLPLIFLTTISLLLCAHPALARKSETSITLRLMACEVTKEQPKVFLETKDSKSDAFDLPSSALTASMEVSGRAVELKAADGNALLSSIALPDQGASFAVLLVPQEPSGFLPIVVRLDDESFKPGEYCFINGSDKTVVVKLGGTEVVVDAGNAVKAHPTEPVHNHHYNVTMSARSDSGDKLFASTRWPLNNAVRSYIMLLSKPGGKINYRSVDESVEKR